MFTSPILNPESIKELELELEQITQEKVRVVKSQRYEEAAKLRDDEKIQAKLETAKSAWEDSIKLNKKLVDEEQVAEVVAMMTGVPQRVAAQEMDRLAEMESTLKSKVIGQDEAVKKIEELYNVIERDLKTPRNR